MRGVQSRSPSNEDDQLSHSSAGEHAREGIVLEEDGGKWNRQKHRLTNVGGKTHPMPNGYKGLHTLQYTHLHDLPARCQGGDWSTTFFGLDDNLNPLAEDARPADIRGNLLRGNHKSAKHQEPRLQSLPESEVTNGWQIILPKVAIFLLKGAVLGPLGIVTQETISESGAIIPKWRMTHDQSFNVVPDTVWSVNDHVVWESLTPCRYGTVLSRYIHVIVVLRQHYLSEIILQTKVDWKSAYHRMHYAATLAVQQSITVIAGYLLLALRMTFGGAPNPSQWSDVSEMACDFLANDIGHHPEWNPAVHPVSPHQDLMASKYISAPKDTTFAQSLPVFVKVPCDGHPTAENFIDDQFMAFRLCHLDRGSAILPFIIHLLGRPIATHESIARDDVLSLKKFLAEATPDEIKTISGWIIDSRHLTIALSHHK
eukprot:scaffold80933_cov58-Attheya_sp.AAC.1